MHPWKLIRPLRCGRSCSGDSNGERLLSGLGQTAEHELAPNLPELTNPGKTVSIPRLRVSIDGASATGKTTLGHRLARRYGASFLDTGLTYRTAAMLLASSEETLQRIASGAWLGRFDHKLARFSADEPERVYIRGTDVTDSIWSAEADAALTEVSATDAAREAILAYHESLLEDEDSVIVAGRDVAITLLRNADLHIVLTAEQEVRAARRQNQYRGLPGRSVLTKGESPLDLKVRNEVAEGGPHLIVDTTDIPPNAVYERALHELESRREGQK